MPGFGPAASSGSSPATSAPVIGCMLSGVAWPGVVSVMFLVTSIFAVMIPRSGGLELRCAPPHRYMVGCGVSFRRKRLTAWGFVQYSCEDGEIRETLTAKRNKIGR